MSLQNLINRLDTAEADFEARFTRLLHWSPEQDQGIEQAVSAILADVQVRGDEALMDYTRRFDRLDVHKAAGLRLSQAELQAALDGLPALERQALERAAERIRRYHEHQRTSSWMYTEADGTRLGQRVLPLDRVGLYVPGGKAAYPSSVLMNAIPAQVAGVKELVMVVPTPDGVRNPAVLAAACLAGIQEVYTIGGAQAVAALAYGTRSIRPVDKIVGPGNAYVAEAKRRVFGTVGIDMIAGPSEILVVSDGSVPADWVAVDLFSQAEHDEMAQAILISPDAAFLDAVAEAIARLLPGQPRRAVIGKSLADRGALIHVRSMQEAAELVNRVAPEHLELAVRDVDGLLADIRHAGAIFMGRWGCEALGDYCAGPSHVLPTMRTPRFSSPLGVYDFQKRSSLIEPSATGADYLAKVAATLARAEGLEAHAQSAEYRLGGDAHQAAAGTVSPARIAARVERHVRPDVQRMAAYHVADATDAIKLDAMENPWRLPGALQAELAQRLAALAINRYPSGNTYTALKQAIARHDGLDGIDGLVLGNGSDELISLLCQLVAQPGATIMAPAPSFVMYEMGARLAGVGLPGLSEQSHRQPVRCRRRARHPAGDRRSGGAGRGLCALCRRCQLAVPAACLAKPGGNAHLLQVGAGGRPHRLSGQCAGLGRAARQDPPALQHQRAGCRDGVLCVPASRGFRPANPGALHRAPDAGAAAAGIAGSAGAVACVPDRGQLRAGAAGRGAGRRLWSFARHPRGRRHAGCWGADQGRQPDAPGAGRVPAADRGRP